MLGTIRAKVLGSVNLGSIKILIGYGIGMMDGGFIRTFQIDEIPHEYRMPNTYLWITFNNNEIIRIKKMSLEEIEQNKWD